MDKTMKLNKKTVIYALSIIAMILLCLFVIPLPKYGEVDFHDLYVWECRQAHAQNMTYILCSGFWREPLPSDFDNPIAVHPLENPEKEIPHGSVLGSSGWKFVFGLYGWVNG